MTILYFIIVFCMCITRFNIIMTLVGGPLTRIDAVNMIPFHSIRENLKYGHSPISLDMLYNIVMSVPFGIIYCYYQRTFCIYKAIGLSVLTTFSIEMAQFILKTGVVDIDDLIVNTIGSLVGIFFYIALQKILQRAQMLDVHEVIDTVATIQPPLFITFVVEMFFGDGSPKLLFIHNIVLISYGIFFVNTLRRAARLPFGGGCPCRLLTHIPPPYFFSFGRWVAGRSFPFSKALLHGAVGYKVFPINTLAAKREEDLSGTGVAA